MLNEQTLTQLKSLRLDGMVAALADHATSRAAGELRFEERLALLVQREIDWRDDKRLTRLLKAARLKVSAACIEDINWRASRGLDRSLITALASGDWLRHARNLLITGATGSGKTGWPARWRTRPPAAAFRCCTCARRGCSTSCRWRTGTAALRVAWRSSPGSTCW